MSKSGNNTPGTTFYATARVLNLRHDLGGICTLVHNAELDSEICKVLHYNVVANQRVLSCVIDLAPHCDLPRSFRGQQMKVNT